MSTRATGKDGSPPAEAQPKAKDPSEEASMLTPVLLEQVESRVMERLLTRLNKATPEEVSQAGDASTRTREGELVHCDYQWSGTVGPSDY